MNTRPIRFLATIGLFLVVSSAVYSQETREDAFDLYREGKCEAAIPIFERLLANEKDDNIVRTYLAGCYFKAGKKKEVKNVLSSFKSGSKKLSDGLETKAKPKERKYARFTEEARNQGIQGTVVLAVEVKADGQIGFIIPVKSLPFGLTENSIGAINATAWTPATRAGKQVDSITIQEFTFSIY